MDGLLGSKAVTGLAARASARVDTKEQGPGRRGWADLAVDGLLAAERSGDNYALIGNVVLNARGRGLALGAAGLARGNTIVNPKYWGVQVLLVLCRPRVCAWAPCTRAGNLSRGLPGGGWSCDACILPDQWSLACCKVKV